MDQTPFPFNDNQNSLKDVGCQTFYVKLLTNNTKRETFAITVIALANY
jgi:hypothetical protein